ncbi:helix-turn-helix domain-containing protein [Photorhabdus sp. CRCIA-P01]|uniref:helix-turn-helix domain-containing protein n=1 Tax=Photorhabdus sp. CRCIA-P01 TaxID=2019570 RepID=UPI000E59C917|nr:helix-turn-helix transcriptional regulator [Photorhabdus sp. CRCIA-P01]
MKKPNTIKSIFGQRVRYIRIASGMSQEAFADKCGLDRTYISGIERGVRNPTLEVINVIASGLQIELKDLFDFNVEKKSWLTLIGALHFV